MALPKARLPPPLPPRIPPRIASTTQQSSDGPPTFESIGTASSLADSVLDEYPALSHNDPRSSSTQSLVPSKSNEHTDLRRLLLIYVHGFMGDVTSFQSFPAHVHHLVAALVAETHVVHTKIYPRYRSKKNISFARDNLSNWLNPHESSETDVILLGHSMGGLLCAEVALYQRDPEHGGRLQHRVLGTINFDVPFLGMHPGVVKSGLASIFSPAAESPKPQAAAGPSTVASPFNESSASGDYMNRGHPASPPSLPSRESSDMFDLQQPDANFNPAFDNDTVLPVRTGWRSVWHFVNKHSGDLTTATKQLVASHLEFGGAMADYSGLKLRYARIRALEEPNFDVRKSVLRGSRSAPRIRFVNYYTASTGRPKKPKTPAVDGSTSQEVVVPVEELDDVQAHTSQGMPSVETMVLTLPDTAIKDRDHDITSEDGESSSDEAGHLMEHLDPRHVSEYGGESSDAESWTDAAEEHEAIDSPSNLHAAEDVPIMSFPGRVSPSSLTPAPSAADSSLSLGATLSLPPLPELPIKPSEPDYTAYPDKPTRKLAEKEHSRALKTYEKVVRDREKAIKDRAKLEEKRTKLAAKESKKAEKLATVADAKQRARDEAKEQARLAKEKEKTAKQRAKDAEKEMKLERKATEREWNDALNQPWHDGDSSIGPREGSNLLTPSFSATSTAQQQKPLKERNFCTLPPKDSKGNRDPCWAKVLMKDVDEVGAHCGLFFVSEAYERLVGDVAERIQEWVAESEGERVARELAEADA